jgi:hypothetical protein
MSEPIRWLDPTNPGASGFILWDDGNEIRCYDLDLPTNYISAISLYVDHKHDGSGATNWVIDAFGRELDLEFCSSRRMTEEEERQVDSLLQDLSDQRYHTQ